jgi:hypothetical protein
MRHSIRCQEVEYRQEIRPENKHDWVPQPHLPAFDELDPLEREVDALLIERGVIGARAGAKLFRQVSEEAAAPQVVGGRFINERRAINVDPNCGWACGKADVLYVANAFEVISKLNKLLAASKKEEHIAAATD